MSIFSCGEISAKGCPGFYAPCDESR